jgi:8-oxo-dGTP diphosphatase
LVSNTDSRRYPPRPILGVGALIYEGDSILLVQRGHEPLKGFWSLPGGAVETGEHLDEAIAREVLEETGLVVRPTSVATIFERILHDAEGRPEYHYVLVDYFCTVLGGQLQAGDDSDQVRWVPLTAVESVKLTEGTREVIQKVNPGRVSDMPVFRA